jgi:UPF0755 protein
MIITASTVLVLILVGAATIMGTFLYINSSPGLMGRHLFHIRRGESAWQVSARLQRNNLVRSARFFRFIATKTGSHTRIQAGRYWIDRSWTTREILDELVKGQTANTRVTIREGLTLNQIAIDVSTALDFTKAEFDSIAADSAIIARYGLPGLTSLEGFLYPDTYYFNSIATPEDVISVMTRRMHAVLSPEWVEHARERYNLTPAEVLTLASIVEKEAVVDTERGIIAQVFLKRLRIGYKLGADPTVKYVMSRFKHRLRNSDIAIDSPYNTYLYHGLPPGPICNPRSASIRAVIWPAKTDFLYFVANWDGTHTFSRSLIEHNRAKRQSNVLYWRMRRAQKRKNSS